MDKKLKSKIDFKQTTPDSFNSDKISFTLSDEYGQMGSIDLPNDYLNVRRIGTIDKDGKIKPLVFAKPKKKKK
jgi:hypothetical protein